MYADDIPQAQVHRPRAAGAEGPQPFRCLLPAEIPLPPSGPGEAPVFASYPRPPHRCTKDPTLVTLLPRSRLTLGLTPS